MSRQSFNSFKELLVKKSFSDTQEKREVRYDVLTKILRFVQHDVIISNIKDFSDEDKKLISAILKLEKFNNPQSKLSNGEYEAIARDQLGNVSDQSKLILIDLLEEEAKDALKEQKKLEKLAAKFHPKDPAEEFKDLQSRIAEIKSSVIDIEMNIMTMENDGQENTEHCKKAKNARERRLQLVSRLEKQLQAVEKKTQKVTSH
ncbi:MAG: hypothetical protein HQL32_11515 [Planctomycetes bacterium]|nr:hypothetical protein [Planctomycetota bacterium]